MTRAKKKCICHGAGSNVGSRIDDDCFGCLRR